MLFHWLHTQAGMTLEAAAAAANETTEYLLAQMEYEDVQAKEIMILASINWLYVRIEKFDPQQWPPGTMSVTWVDFPDWVRSVYKRTATYGY